MEVKYSYIHFVMIQLAPPKHSRSFLRLFLVLILVQFTTVSFAQYSDPDPQIRTTIATNFAELQKQLVGVNAPNIPAQRNGKWGIVNEKTGAEVVPFVYDSLRSFSYRPYFIAFKDNEWYLMNDSAQFSLNEPFQKIAYDGVNMSIVVTDINGKSTHYWQGPDNRTLMTVDPRSNPGRYIDPYNRERSKRLSALNPYSEYLFENPYVDYMIVRRDLIVPEFKHLSFVKNDTIRWSLTTLCRPEFVDGSQYISLENDTISYIIDIVQKDTVLVLPKITPQQDRYKNQYPFIYESQLYYVQYDNYLKETFIGNVSGEKILALEGDFEYWGGYLNQRVHTDNGTRKIYYSFPDGKLLSKTPLRDIYGAYKGWLMTENKKHKYTLWFKGNPVYSFFGKGYSIHVDIRGELMCLSIQNYPKLDKSSYVLFDKYGTIILESQEQFRLEKSENFNQIRLLSSTEDGPPYGIRKEKMGIWNEEKQRLDYYPFDMQNARQLGPNLFLLYTENGDFFTDLNGELLLDKSYTFDDDQPYIISGGKHFVLVTQNGVPKVLDQNLQLVCDSCYANPITSEFLILNKELGSTTFEVFDPKTMEKALPGKYLAVYYHLFSRCFFVMNEDHTVEYIHWSRPIIQQQ